MAPDIREDPRTLLTSTTTPRQPPAPPAPSDEDERPRLQLSGAQVAASALAATTSAFAASTLGVAGTLGGAAVGSVVATIGSAVYIHFFRRTGQTVRTVVLRSPSGTPLGVSTTDVTDDAAPPAGPTEDVGSTPAEEPARRLNRRALVLSVLAVFALAIGTVTAVELIAGQPVGSPGDTATGRTTIGSVLGGSAAEADSGETIPGDGTGTGTAPGDAESGTEQPPEEAPGQVPTGEPIPTPTPAPTGGAGEAPAPEPAQTPVQPEPEVADPAAP
ncbi:MAG TPA: hypothetical protein VK908_06205 [Jiangellales bacterium]|nr:hypothetical protein [Jiangellales bacterium]